MTPSPPPGIARGGKAVYGAPLGILMLEARFPRIPGDMGNAATWPFPVLYRVVRGASPEKVVLQGARGLLPDFIKAAKELVGLGAEAITTNCGFLSLFQNELQSAVNVPVATSALMQVRWVQAMLPPGKQVGVITVSGSTLTPAHLESAGAPLDTPVVGTENGREFFRVLIKAEKDDMDVAAAEQDATCRTAHQAVAADRTGVAFTHGSILDQMLIADQNPDAPPLIGIAAGAMKNPVGVMFLQSSGIKTPADLRGKKIGVPTGSLSEQYLDVFLAKQGIPKSAVTIINTAFAAQQGALLTKQVDAISAFARAIASLEIAVPANDKIGSFLFGDYNMPSPLAGVTIQKSLLDKQPLVARAIALASVESFHFCVVNLGFGHTFFETYKFDGGQIINGTLVDYKVPTFDDLPGEFESVLIEDGNGPGPYGAKGLGEGGIIPVAPAVANAVAWSTGARVKSLPLTPEKVWRAIQEGSHGKDQGKG